MHTIKDIAFLNNVQMKHFFVKIQIFFLLIKNEFFSRIIKKTTHYYCYVVIFFYFIYQIKAKINIIFQMTIFQMTIFFWLELYLNKIESNLRELILFSDDFCFIFVPPSPTHALTKATKNRDIFILANLKSFFFMCYLIA